MAPEHPSSTNDDTRDTDRGHGRREIRSLKILTVSTGIDSHTPLVDREPGPLGGRRRHTYDEDRSQIRTGTGPEVRAALRDAAISALRLSGATNIAAANRHHARDSTRPLALLGII